MLHPVELSQAIVSRKVRRQGRWLTGGLGACLFLRSYPGKNMTPQDFIAKWRTVELKATSLAARPRASGAIPKQREIMLALVSAFLPRL